MQPFLLYYYEIFKRNVRFFLSKIIPLVDLLNGQPLYRLSSEYTSAASDTIHL